MTETEHRRAEAVRHGTREPHDTSELLRAEIRGLRARALAHPLIALAQGILQERYTLPDPDCSFTLMRRASQQHNIKLRTVAEAVVTVPRPEARAVLWFPRRVRTPEPALTFPAAPHTGSATRGAVLTAVLSRTLAVADSPRGHVQLADRTRGGLRIERHIGHGAEFVDFFAHVGDDGTACARAARDAVQVTVRDVATDPVFTEEARRAVLADGGRACHSVPLTSERGRVLGMVSAYFDRPVEGLDEARLKALEVIGAQAGRWLAWYERTVVLDALEYLHALARRGSGR
ncbi:GAF and ANTAR domain-containing protein [Streptomyces sp. NPDC058867]|uniref:GAF and ANTAR domain-containing protein n=1 Tax=unclassified Streptomyces TaxID=2593676 RepID=UPI00369E918B